ncbi:50S ribosomal protein L32 [Candidatus Uhrbacteria bacterium RIFCSPHIGHO2_01_FULL_63_20]|uniref:Large ribosomal subunit protein bL32 n=1 Tax=Candidatus Uhrbacteria bacterium RIFCSPHIGHO2_01_FULL_63_20 TaxID=1802385 RepID=A0A1F7TML6_9BACT|nr:MAG: 50S ribosomal protein L32 [Candidatus Uhrbacteria bacterium RIFCSPHIGHO2_01_FULL_63_20]
MKKVALAACAKCKAPIAPHRACTQCGTYAGRRVVDTSRAAARLVKKAKTAAPAHAHEHKEKEAEVKK